MFCLSLPLDLPGGNVLNPRRHPPQLKPTFRDGAPYLNSVSYTHLESAYRHPARISATPLSRRPRGPIARLPGDWSAAPAPNP